MERIEIKRATTEYIPDLVRLRIAFSDELNGKQEEERENALRQSLTLYYKKELNKNYFSWLALNGDEIIAVAGMVHKVLPGGMRNITGRWGYIMSVYTLPAWRRKGLSTLLMNKLEETGREIGITAFELHATPDGEPVYLKCGFKKHSEPTYRKLIQQ